MASEVNNLLGSGYSWATESDIIAGEITQEAIALV